MYTRINNREFRVNDNASYTSIDGAKYPNTWDKSTIEELAHITETDCPTGCFIIGYSVDESFEQVWSSREYNAEEIAQQKINLLVVLDSKQAQTLATYQDKWLTKYVRASLINDVNLVTIQAKSAQVSLWGDAILALNDALTVDSELTAIQTQIDNIDALIALFPYTTQEAYDADTLGFRS